MGDSNRLDAVHETMKGLPTNQKARAFFLALRELSQLDQEDIAQVLGALAVYFGVNGAPDD